MQTWTVSVGGLVGVAGRKLEITALQSLELREGREGLHEHSKSSGETASPRPPPPALHRQDSVFSPGPGPCPARRRSLPVPLRCLYSACSKKCKETERES